MLWVDNTSRPQEIIENYLLDGDVIENIFYLRSPSRNTLSLFQLS
jgi:hypothetical protein